MNGNKVIIDTNIVIEVFSGNSLIAQQLKLYEDIYLPDVVIGELYVGVYHSKDEVKHEALLTGFLKSVKELSIDKKTALIYGKIMAELYSKGKPIPTNDVWISALSIQHNLPLLTLDKHFSYISDIKLISVAA